MTKRIAVIGAGVVGLATAWALERRGFTCLVFEEGAPGGAQSAGESRIFRHAHADPRQFELALRARRDWREWEEEFNSRLISPDGAMVIGQEAVARLQRYADEPAIKVRELDPGKIGEVLPLLASFPGPALIDETAGAIRTTLAIANLINAVGINLVPERVESVRPRPEGGVEVTSTSGARVVDAAVVAAGTGTVDLAAGAGVTIPVSTRAHVRLTVPIVSPDPSDQLACLQDSSGHFGEFGAYGSPVRGNRHYAVGLSLAARVGAGQKTPDPLDRLAERTAAYVERALPGVDTGEAVTFQRWVTELPWAADGLAIWQRGDAFFIAGQNLFKLAPALGKVLARCVASGSVETGFSPGDRLGEPVSETAGPAG